MATKIKLGKGNWGVKENGLLAYNDEDNIFKAIEMNHSRSSTATRVNSAGLVAESEIGVPRIDFQDDSNGALLLEPQSTNLVTDSIPINSLPYDYANGGVASAPIVTTNQGISPDGSLNASKIDFNLNGGTTSSDISQMAYVGSSLTGDYTSSFYLKSFDSNSYTVTLVDPNGATSQEVITPEWQRFTFYNGGGTTSTNLIRIRLRGNEGTSNTASLLAYGFQLENLSYATSYIPTSGAIATRIADTCSKSGLENYINSSEGVLYFDIKALADDRSLRFISIYDNSNTTNRIEFRYNNVGETIRVVYVSSSSIIYDHIETLTVTNQNKIALKWSNNNFSLYVNGVKVNEQLSGSTFVGNLNTLDFDQFTNSFPFYGKVKDLRVYDTALTDAELQSLTS